MNLTSRDSQVIWHPYTQMQNAGLPIPILHAKGAYLFAEDGRRYIDAIASWWTNIHGHAHPYLAESLYRQATKLEHLIFAGFTHEPAVHLAERLVKVLPRGQEKIFYSDNGSTAVEVALKMAFQFWHNAGSPRTKVIALRDAYHGDTFGAMSVSGRSAFTRPFDPLLFEVIFMDAPLPGKGEESVYQLEKIIHSHPGSISAFIYEPLLQGTAGMKVMETSFLNELISICKKNQVLCIADEVMTGFGRTGKMFASDYLDEKPDMVCLSKGLTGGMMALGATTCTTKVYEAFLSDDRMKTFFHGHSYTANPLACAAGIASLELFEKENTFGKIELIQSMHKSFALKIQKHPALKEVRTLGVVIALEIDGGGESSYFHPGRDKAYQWFLDAGVLIRPLGNILYLMPPYCIKKEDLEYIYGKINQYLDSIV